MTEHVHDESCRALAERISEFVDGELPDEVRATVAEHLDACATCEAFVNSLARVKALGAFLPRLELSPDRLRELARLADHPE